MKVAYIRVSTDEQNTIRQEVIMEELGVEKIYIEKVSGKSNEREQLQSMLEFVREGDTVVVESYSRLARSAKGLLEIIDIFNQKKVHFISKKENIDTSTPSGKLMLTIFAGIYEFERECLLQRQAEGIKEAKKNGKYKGRKPITLDESKFKQLYIKWKDNEITAVEMQKGLILTPSTFYRKVREYEKTNNL